MVKHLFAICSFNENLGSKSAPRERLVPLLGCQNLSSQPRICLDDQEDVSLQKVSVFLPVTTKVGLFLQLMCQTCVLLPAPGSQARGQPCLAGRCDSCQTAPGPTCNPCQLWPAWLPQLPLTLTAKLPKVFSAHGPH